MSNEQNRCNNAFGNNRFSGLGCLPLHEDQKWSENNFDGYH